MLRRLGGRISSEDARGIRFHESAVVVQLPGNYVVTGMLRRNIHYTDMVNIPKWMPEILF